MNSISRFHDLAVTSIVAAVAAVVIIAIAVGVVVVALLLLIFLVALLICLLFLLQSYDWTQNYVLNQNRLCRYTSWTVT